MTTPVSDALGALWSASKPPNEQAWDTALTAYVRALRTEWAGEATEALGSLGAQLGLDDAPDPLPRIMLELAAQCIRESALEGDA